MKPVLRAFAHAAQKSAQKLTLSKLKAHEALDTFLAPQHWGH
ncbi:MAG TPA: hypothetical protein VHR36_02800 [Pyrinomonadaceae bacterium]|nr:hypothetical protein [Pyrinomonadaceae bacterium]